LGRNEICLREIPGGFDTKYYNTFYSQFYLKSEKGHQQQLLAERINVGKIFANPVYDWQACHKLKVA